MESFNGERKFISSDYSCGVAVLLPVGNCNTAVSPRPGYGGVCCVCVLLSSPDNYSHVQKYSHPLNFLAFYLTLHCVLMGFYETDQHNAEFWGVVDVIFQQKNRKVLTYMFNFFSLTPRNKNLVQQTPFRRGFAQSTMCHCGGYAQYSVFTFLLKSYL